MTVRYEVGDTRAVVATLATGSVSLVASSPPFIALRSYLPDDHPDKHAEIGSEPDPATFLDTLLELTAEWGRVLAPWGSIAIELGDTYAGSGGAGGDYGEGGLRDGQGKADGSQARTRVRTDGGQYGNHPQGGTKFNVETRPIKGSTGWPRAKSLALIPQLYATSLAYGRNLLTGQPSPAGQWLVRNVIVWHRPNPAVGALGDKVRPSTSYITVATRSPKRWFDLDAVRQPYLHPNHGQIGKDRNGDKAEGRGNWSTLPTRTEHPAGAPPLDCWFDHHDTWTLTTQPSSLAHYAMWPAKLAERLILMMCPAEVCAVCGEGRRRVTETARFALQGGYGNRRLVPPQQHESGRSVERDRQPNQGVASVHTTLGWSDCGHGDYRPGVVLDPFAGTFTTGAVAEFHGRGAVGVDIDARNRDLYPLRREEVFRALNPTHVRQADGQMGLFG